MSGEERRKQLRLPGYDYGQAGGYFITICTEHREQTLSSIQAGHPPDPSPAGAGHLSHLSSAGAGHLSHPSPAGAGHSTRIPSVGAGHLAGLCAYRSGPVVELTEIGRAVDTLIRGIPQAYPTARVEKYVVMPNHIHLLLRIVQAGPAGCPAPTIPRIIGALKSMSARRSGKPLWQRGYYDHVIRNEADCLRIWQYIDTNPAKWIEDKYYVP